MVYPRRKQSIAWAALNLLYKQYSHYARSSADSRKILPNDNLAVASLNCPRTLGFALSLRPLSTARASVQVGSAKEGIYYLCHCQMTASMPRWTLELTWH